MLKNMKKAFAFLFAVTAAIQFVTVSFTITADASELTEYFIDTSGYTNADDVFNKYSSKLRRQNYTENGGQVYEAKGDMIRKTIIRIFVWIFSETGSRRRKIIQNCV